MPKVLIAAQIDLDPAQREQALTSSRKWIEGALSQDGCIRYDWSADGNDPARVNVFEEWESQEALAAHFDGPQYAGMRDHMAQFDMRGAVSAKYLVSHEGPVYNEEGLATPSFD